MKQLARQLRSNQTEAERKLWRKLRSRNIHGHKFRRQETIGSFIVDFVCFDKKLIIELDGGQHVEQSGADQTRTARLEKRGYRVIRFWNHQVLNDFDAVLDRILEEIDLPHPNLLPEGEGVRNARTTVKADNTDA